MIYSQSNSESNMGKSHKQFVGKKGEKPWYLSKHTV